MSTFADEVAALRGTRPATFKDLITHPAFSKLLIAQTVSSLGDWVGFVAVTALVVSKGGNAGAYAVAGVMVARMLPAILFGPIAGAIVDRVNRKTLMITADISRGALYALMPFLGPAVDDLRGLVRDRVLLPAVDALPRRLAAEPGPPAAARERELARPHHDLRDAAAGCARVHVPVGRVRPVALLPGQLGVPRAVAGRVHVRALGVARQPDPDPAAGADVVREARPLARRQGHRWTASGSCARTRSRRR